MMKRYSLTVKVREDYGAFADVIERENGEWIRYEDAKKIHHENFRLEIANGELKAEITRLKELNQEMVEVIKKVKAYDIYETQRTETDQLSDNLRCEIQEVLAKAGEVGE